MRRLALVFLLIFSFYGCDKSEPKIDKNDDYGHDGKSHGCCADEELFIAVLGSFSHVF